MTNSFITDPSCAPLNFPRISLRWQFSAQELLSALFSFLAGGIQGLWSGWWPSSSIAFAGTSKCSTFQHFNIFTCLRHVKKCPPLCVCKAVLHFFTFVWSSEHSLCICCRYFYCIINHFRILWEITRNSQTRRCWLETSPYTWPRELILHSNSDWYPHFHVLLYLPSAFCSHLQCLPPSPF